MEPARGDGGGDRVQFPLVRLGLDGAVGAHPGDDLEHRLARDQGAFAADAEIVRVGQAPARQFHHVAVATADHQRDRGSAFLDDGVQRQGGAVRDHRHVGRRRAFGGQQRTHPGLHRGRGVGGNRWFLVDAQAAIAQIGHHEVGEGAADIHADAPARRALPLHPDISNGRRPTTRAAPRRVNAGRLPADAPAD
jgi:hypothetical protein